MIDYNADEGIAPVVAMLLILAVIVTVMSVYFNTYVPSLKEEAEIDHLSDVQKEFLSFSSDLENAVWQKSEGRLSRSFELGGGDVFLSSIKSGGVLEVEEDARLFNISSTSANWNSSLVRFAYEPVSNFWQDQGYSWQYGYVNLTTGYNITTPLQYTDMNDTIQAVENDSGIFRSLFDLNYIYEPVFQTDGLGNYTGTKYRNCTEITITITSLEKGVKDYVSGNGVAMLALETDIETSSFNETRLNFSVNTDVLMGVNNTIWECINEKLVDFNSSQFDNVEIVSCYPDATDDDIGKDLDILFIDPVKVNIKQVKLTVSAKV
ncbi:conserved hypothetical protein [Methanolacinia petrolearia DSM 11571]|uniref:Archaeal Type IV pilin N-terminal domain-containing protein n=1 Tax=Methanolacinia petrolearia (strain DSM 11571 / OCM 486 / SEBR 4847) TaxID=679926 RepID=E1RI05_METP4|nr:hypothetical protein [Methanolacinia petrolearia]ADN35390.1 conserved hypothetical protein [Methanolacinia petrolearia DSM 11571]